MVCPIHARRYVQAMVDANNDVIARQTKEIRQLRGGRSRGKGSSAPDGVQKRKIHELESRLKEAELALKKRYPDSISNLIRAAGPSDEEQGEMRRLVGKVAELVRVWEIKILTL